MQPGGDLLYNLLGAGIVLVIGFALVMKAGNKFGWILIVAAAIYGFLSLKPTIRESQIRNAAPGKGGYFRDR